MLFVLKNEIKDVLEGLRTERYQAMVVVEGGLKKSVASKAENS